MVMSPPLITDEMGVGTLVSVLRRSLDEAAEKNWRLVVRIAN